MKIIVNVNVNATSAEEELQKTVCEPGMSVLIGTFFFFSRKNAIFGSASGACHGQRGLEEEEKHIPDTAQRLKYNSD